MTATEELQTKLIQIVESFDQWLEDTGKQQNMSKDDVQALIKQLLQ